ncbi:type IVB secretion system protein IcmJDotN [Flexibacterium corallicola]|uniref:type IVB secretion system protein IcmJDotN n=1 Tax=Flexibacterium corallicola TaxID=3037259 RepID=UPI00286F1AB3|nr:type IVB secretion system protein IcmJDotN [Pseudovibrio sp. M1P-2-3]
MAGQKQQLILSVKCKNWRMNSQDSHKADTEFKTMRTKALKRDKQTCQFCGFKDKQWQEVHHLNDDHSDNRLSNLITICAFCHNCHHIGYAGVQKEAVLIWAPEVTQQELHHIVRSCLVAKAWADKCLAKPGILQKVRLNALKNNDSCQALLSALRARTRDAEKWILTSDPTVLANMLLTLPHKDYQRRHEFLSGIRLLPLGYRAHEGGNLYEQRAKKWIEQGGVYSNLKPETWSSLADGFLNS